MEFFKIRSDIPFMRHALVFNVISLITFVLAVFFLATKGLHFSIEFTGGTLMEVELRAVGRRRAESAQALEKRRLRRRRGAELRLLARRADPHAARRRARRAPTCRRR